MHSLVKRFNSAELLTFTYIVITAFHILLFGRTGSFAHISSLLLCRIAFSAAIFLVVLISEQFGNRFAGFIRYVFPFALIAYWYPETYYLGGNENSALPHSIIMSNIDGLLDRLDMMIFGCLPAMEFSKAFPQAWVSEIMYFGYFAYYLIFLVTFIYFFFVKPDMAEAAMFYCLCSFFIFYIIFICVPAAGPQFYYSYPDSQVPEGYFFSWLMRSIQDMGEKPTGAFPSSHVGLTLIAMILLYGNSRKYFYAILPTAIILVASTVYIKAHYLVDVLAAFIVAPFIFVLSRLIFGLYKHCNLFSSLKKAVDN
ncbi:MAG: phosphatase PAP2 family protein [Prevotellaceae bacterium]|jgi:membrane-associated phospholipid phosphatase|nr:phosphatase PAP2 family protein [Prevotellaceae bacterium]